MIAILKDTRMSCGKYLLAKCYFQTGNLDLASGALLRDHGLDNPLEMEEKLFKDYTSVPGGYAGLYLLGCIAKKKGNVGHAEEYFRLALAANPFCWTAYEKLCALGSSYADPDDYFGDKKCFGGTWIQFNTTVGNSMIRWEQADGERWVRHNIAEQSNVY